MQAYILLIIFKIYFVKTHNKYQNIEIFIIFIFLCVLQVFFSIQTKQIPSKILTYVFNFFNFLINKMTSQKIEFIFSSITVFCRQDLTIFHFHYTFLPISDLMANNERRVSEHAVEAFVSPIIWKHNRKAF